MAAIPLLTWPLVPGTTVSARKEVSGVECGMARFTEGGEQTFAVTQMIPALQTWVKGEHKNQRSN